MNTFSLIRTRWSNEKVMTAVFGVLVLYLLPLWIHHPESIPAFLAVLAAALLTDTVLNLIRYRCPICGVSAAVTAGVFYILTPGTYLWVRVVGVAAALLAGKHVWGGTGKNPVNPALAGVLIIGLVLPVNAPDFTPQLSMLPALLLSIPFIRFRPYAAAGFMAGMAAVMVLGQNFGFDSYLSYGAVFWGCLVLTDPVTVTPRPVLGAAGGAVTGALAMLLSGSTVAMAGSILLFNVVCYIADSYLKQPLGKLARGKCVGGVMARNSEVLFFDLSQSREETCEVAGEEAAALIFSSQEIMERLERNEVAGLGGAAFPTAEKVKRVIEARVEKKYFIINAVECDPGLIHDGWLLDRCMEEICTGIKLIQQCVSFEVVVLAVKETKTIKACNVNVAKVPDYYPVGAERELIRQVLGKGLSAGDIPAEKGILVLNVQTVFSAFEAVARNKRALTKYITVADINAKTAYVVKTKLGADIRAITDKLPLTPGNIFAGGGAMQCRNVYAGDLVDRHVSFIAVARFSGYKESILCSRCGFCDKSCPMGLAVSRISQLVEQGRLEEAKKYKLETCLQCGNCSRVCLAGRNLAARVKAAKAG